MRRFRGLVIQAEGTVCAKAQGCLPSPQPHASLCGEGRVGDHTGEQCPHVGSAGPGQGLNLNRGGWVCLLAVRGPADQAGEQAPSCYFPV